MNRRYILFIVLCFLFVSYLKAGDTVRYTLPACREMALMYGTSSKGQEEAQLAAKYNRQAALAAMFPRVSVNGGYMWNSRNAHFLSDQSTFSFGTATVAPNGSASFVWSDGSTFGRLSNAVAGTILERPIADFSDKVAQKIADAYKYVYDAATIDMTHILVARVSLMQPIYTGGRLTQMYNIAKATENIATIETNAKKETILYNVDEAYWRVVAVTQKKRLAEQYHALLCQLEQDVKEAVEEGVATQSDLLTVITKRGEADVKKLQAENGLILSNMALAQVCGLPLSTNFVLDENGLNEITLSADFIKAEAEVDKRSELQILEQTQKIAKSTTKLAGAGLQPNILAHAGYTYTNPNFDNGISNTWNGKGFFTAGVVVNVPIVHADAMLRYKAAKHAANVVALQTEETREKLILQTTQANQKLAEAQQKIILAQLTKKNAEEVLRMAQESFAAGMITASELMQAQTLWLSAATDLVDAQVEAKTTEAKLRKYLGTL